MICQDVVNIHTITSRNVTNILDINMNTKRFLYLRTSWYMIKKSILKNPCGEIALFVTGTPGAAASPWPTHRTIRLHHPRSDTVPTLSRCYCCCMGRCSMSLGVHVGAPSGCGMKSAHDTIRCGKINAAVAAVENRSLEEVRRGRWLRCMQTFYRHDPPIWSYRCTTTEVQPRSDIILPAGEVARADS